MLTLLEQTLNWLNSESLAARTSGMVLLVGAGILVAYLIRALLSRTLLKLFEFLKKGSSTDIRRSSQASKVITKLLPRAVFWFVIIFSFILGIQNLAGLPLFETWTEQIAVYLPKVFTAILLVLSGIWGGIILKETIIRVGTAGGMNYARGLGVLAKGATIVISAIIAVRQIGVDLTFLTVLAGVSLGAILFGASLAFGLGAKVMASNIITSHYIQKIYRVGSTVEIEGLQGVIIDISGPLILLETPEGQVAIPARKFSQSASKRIAINPESS